MQLLVRSLLTFYKSLLPLSFIVSLICIFVTLKTDFNLFMMMFWFKVFMLAITLYFVADARKKEFYYYQNLGISRTILLVLSFSIDLMLFLLVNLMAYTYL